MENNKERNIERLERLMDREFAEWIRLMNANITNKARKTELEHNIREYSTQYQELTGHKYIRKYNN